ncbi:MAG: hypothetical protein E7453_06155 [Ruminococcaceae bacterium]|nr:hypothetical protein [Oscillospiraceae bacterium]
MSFRYPVPNEQQSERLRIHGMDPGAYMVISADKDGRIYLKHYKTGDEVWIHPNSLKFAQQRI